MDEGSRAVATTASPLARTASIIKVPNPRVAPVMNQIFMCLSVRSIDGTASGKHLRELDEVPPGVGEKRQPAADDGQLKWLGDDRHAAPAELGDGFIDAGNVEAKVMETRKAQAVAKILIRRLRNWAGLAVAE